MVNLEWFRSFKAIYETGSLTGAAEALFISQPGVSLHLNSLEAYVGYKLFDRTSRKMVSTERGKILYNYVQEAVSRLEDAERHFHKSNEKDIPTINIGMCFETFQFTLESYLPTLPFNVFIKFGEYPEMLADLDSGVLDMIITPQKGDYKGLEYKPFFKEKIVVIAGTQTNTAGLDQLVSENDVQGVHNWLITQKWYGTASDMEHLRRFWHANFGKRPDFKHNYIVPNMSSIIRCLSNGNGVAVIPDFLSKKELDAGHVHILWDGFNRVENTLYFGARKKSIYAEQIKMIEEIFVKEMVGI
ncbi:LysR family transcriptional regulator [Mucilaginibacter celer]|uniref:LysR family transcriptional regulator n=1 Tax=Mucilaginibacter celer TaxID=2305508 RepID=A0A494VN40_9SPHI|nr:LysR family transcriptional regulator [Mucilaginibacter celer]AYL95569.1 LysR family transcriptional regulator [Mucilaginibacter celer]